MNDKWIEVRVVWGDLRSVYEAADECGCVSIHHFYEPWYEEGAVVRVLPDGEDAYAQITDRFSDAYVVWDSTPDEELFGDDWGTVRAFFEAGSRLALLDSSTQGSFLHRKAFHCLMNSLGYSRKAEMKFGLRTAWGHVRLLAHGFIWPKLHRRGRCKWGCHNSEWQT